MNRKGFRCFECDGKAQHAHHIVPKSLGGTRTLPFCHKCHSKIHRIDFTNVSSLIKKGLAKAKASGTVCHRPLIDICFKTVRKHRKAGLSWKSVGKLMGIAEETVRWRYSRENS